MLPVADTRLVYVCVSVVSPAVAARHGKTVQAVAPLYPDIVKIFCSRPAVALPLVIHNVPDVRAQHTRAAGWCRPDCRDRI